MKSYSKDLLNKKIIMISDYVNPQLYEANELADEREMLKRIESEMLLYKVPFEYIEFKTPNQIEEYLYKQDASKCIIFNWCEEFPEIPNSAYLVTEILEDLGFIYTGANTKCLKVTQDKILTNKLLLENKICVPKQYKKEEIQFPVIVKYRNMHSSVGIDNASVVYSYDDLNKKEISLASFHKGELIYEEFIDGREFSVPVWGNSTEARVIDVLEIEYLDKSINIIQTEKSKFEEDSSEAKNSVYTELKDLEMKNCISKIALEAYKALGIYDYARFEVRLSGSVPYLIDANPNPALFIGSSLFLLFEKASYSIGEFILQICQFALDRNSNG